MIYFQRWQRSDVKGQFKSWVFSVRLHRQMVQPITPDSVSITNRMTHQWACREWMNNTFNISQVIGNRIDSACDIWECWRVFFLMLSKSFLDYVCCLTADPADIYEADCRRTGLKWGKWLKPARHWIENVILENSSSEHLTCCEEYWRENELWLKHTNK